MHSYRFDLEPFPIPDHGPHEYDFPALPAMARLHAVSGLLIEVFGPMFWAALLVLFVQAELFGT